MTNANDSGESTSLQVLAALHCAPNAPKLADTELRGHLTSLTGWNLSGNRLEKTFRFADYYRTMAFVNCVAGVAHREDHHPDLEVHYDRCAVGWSTHSAGGITMNDCICAAKTESLYA